MITQIDSLEDVFVHELQGAYYVEARLVGMLDEMADNASNADIGAGFADHAEETRTHVDRLETVFEAVDREVAERESPVVESLDEERRAFEDHVTDDDLVDKFYLTAGTKTERLELTTYESLIQVAEQLDLDGDVVDALEANRASEREALDQLQVLPARRSCNRCGTGSRPER